MHRHIPFPRSRPALLGLALAVAVGSAPTAVDARPTAGNVALFHRTATRYGGEIFPRMRVEARRRRLIIAQGYHYRLIRRLRAANPAIDLLLYKEAAYADASARRPPTSPTTVAGVDYAQALRRGWVLRDGRGKAIHRVGHSAYVLMDIGNPGYQRQWAANVITEARRFGWSGVFADDLALILGGTTGTPVRYPSPAAWQRAELAFVAAVGPRLHAAGLLLYTNTASGISYPAVRHALLAHVDGTMEEGWMRPTTRHDAPLATSVAWRRQLHELADSEAQHKGFLAELPADSAPLDRAAVRYGLASFLLVARGHASFDVAGNPTYRAPVWLPDFDRAARLGRPSTRYVVLRGGVFRRRFAHGVVVVNPTTAVRVARLGGRYWGPGVHGAAAVRLQPATGLVLTARAR